LGSSVVEVFKILLKGESKKWLCEHSGHRADFAGNAESREDASGGSGAWYVATCQNRVAAELGVLNYKLDINI
jgi:hypothetical protein